MGARATEAGVKAPNLPRVRTAVAVGNAPILELVHSPRDLPTDCAVGLGRLQQWLNAPLEDEPVAQSGRSLHFAAKLLRCAFLFAVGLRGIAQGFSQPSGPRAGLRALGALRAEVLWLLCGDQANMPIKSLRPARIHVQVVAVESCNAGSWRCMGGRGDPDLGAWGGRLGPRCGGGNRTAPGCRYKQNRQPSRLNGRLTRQQ